MQSDSSGSGKRGLTEKFEHYFGKSVSIKVAVCLGLAISCLAALLIIALFMNVFTPGSVADAQANVSANGSSSLPANGSMTVVNDTDHMANSTKDSLDAAEEGDTTRRYFLSYIYNFTSRPIAATPRLVSTPTPMVAPKLPLEVLWDRTFYESIEPIQNYDRQKLLVDDTSYRFDNGPLLLDPSGTYGGSVYAYPGDTIGIRLHIYNNGGPLSTVARVNITLLKIMDTNNSSFMDTGVDLDYDMSVDANESTGMEKSLLINIPENNSDSAGYYRLNIKLYVNDTLSSDMSKEFNVL
jgi:hypothetical protein